MRSAALLVLITLVSPGHAAGRLPFPCFTLAWDGVFTVSSVRHDTVKNEIVWELTAKHDADLGDFEAFVSDGDGVEVTTVPVKFDIVGKKLKAMTKVRAVVSLGGHAVADIARVQIRPGS